jgi:hypothetical protein
MSNHRQVFFADAQWTAEDRPARGWYRCVNLWRRIRGLPPYTERVWTWESPPIEIGAGESMSLTVPMPKDDHDR